MIYIVYAMYIPEICIVDINCIYNEYSLYKPGISEPDWYMHGIFMVYTWHISVICRPHQYVRYMSSSYLMGLFRTFFYNYILMIYFVYPCDIHYTSRSSPIDIACIYCL
jgi:hypothetical protein